jgi:bifunctional non-homologous end joining protein LigD
MLATTGTAPEGEGWVAEVKWDGFRLIATLDDRLRLHTRPGTDATEWFPELGDVPTSLRGHDVVLDGEVIVCNDEGLPSFHLLRRHLAVRRRQPVADATFCVFDVLWLDGEALWRRPWHERRQVLEALEVHSARWKAPRSFPGDDLTDVTVATKELGLEGVVFKQVDAPYQPGRRSKHWVKTKHLRHDELVVGGLVTGSGRRPLTGLVVGWPRDDGLLDYARVVEVGFRPGERAAIVSTLDRCRSEVCPFARRPMLSRVEWVEPALVVEVRSLASATGQWLREPVFSRVVRVREPFV